MVFAVAVQSVSVSLFLLGARATGKATGAASLGLVIVDQPMSRLN